MSSALAQGSEQPGELPTRFTCRFDDSRFSVPEGRLLLPGDSHPFATVVAPQPVKGTFIIPSSLGEPYAMRLTSAGVALRVDVVPKERVGLFPAADLWLGVARLGSDARLELSGVDAGKLLVEASLAGWRPVAPLRATLACDEVAPAPGRKRSPRTSEPSDGGIPVELRSETPIDVSATPGGPPLGAFVTGTRTRSYALSAIEWERAGGWVKVERTVGRGVVTGWVAEAVVSPRAVPDKGGLASGVGGLGFRSGRQPRPELIRCGTTTRLFVSRAGTWRVVGELNPGATLVRGRTVGDFVEVELPGGDGVGRHRRGPVPVHFHASTRARRRPILAVPLTTPGCIASCPPAVANVGRTTSASNGLLGGAFDRALGTDDVVSL
ncbi:MAG: hypothetical protein MUC96_36660 [Myxococcaceae bacterium]|nr:hypothetical protein [Myxococcaceae bacterium]